MMENEEEQKIKNETEQIIKNGEEEIKKCFLTENFMKPKTVDGVSFHYPDILGIGLDYNKSIFPRSFNLSMRLKGDDFHKKYDDDEINTKIVLLRGVLNKKIEKMVADLMHDGVFKAKDKPVSFDRDSELTVSLTGKDKWDAGVKGVDMLKNLRKWRKVFEKSGAIADSIIMGSRACGKFTSDSFVEEKLNRGEKKGEIYTDFSMANKHQETYGRYIGTLDGLDIYRYYGSYTDKLKNQKCFIFKNSVLILPKNFGHVVYCKPDHPKASGEQKYYTCFEPWGRYEIGLACHLYSSVAVVPNLENNCLRATVV